MPVAAPSVIQPAFLWRPPSAVGDLGDEVAELAVQLEQQVDAEERIALGALTPVQANGMPAGLEAGIVCGRRQVKSWALEMCTIHDAYVTKVHRVVWTAHLTETSDDNFDHLTALIESFDWLRKRTRRIYRGNGDHRVMLNNGGRIEFTARESGKTGRGRDVNRLVLDEWLFGTAGTLGAMVPMLGGVKDRYIRYGSSPGLLKSEALRDLRDRGRRGGDPSLSWCEWTSERLVDGKRVLPKCADPNCTHRAGVVAGCILDDEDIRRSVNPAYGRRLSREFIDQERLAMPPVEYMRERCGIWEDPPPDDVRDKLFPLWPQRAGTPIPAPGARVALGVDTSWDRSASWIAAATELPDGRVRGEVVATGPGTGWVRGWLLERLDTLIPTGVAMQASGAPVSTLHEELALHLPDAHRERLKGLTAADMARASGLMFDLIDRGGLAHVPHPALDGAAAEAIAKPMSDAWVIDRKKSGTDVSPLVALSAAVAALVGSEPEYDPLANLG